MTVLLAYLSTELLWRNALAAVPLAIGVAIFCRCLPTRPATRHALWVIVLLSLLAPPSLPGVQSLLTGHPIAVASNEAVIGVANLPVDRSPSATHENDCAPALLPTLIRETPSQPVERNFTGWHESSFTDPHLSGAMIPTPPAVVSLRLPQPAEHSAAPPTLSPPGPLPAGASQAQPTVASPSAFVSTMNQWRAQSAQWLSQLAAVRDALVRVSPIPTVLWLAGSVALIGFLCIRILRFRRILHSAKPAPGSVRRMVVRASGAIGLNSIPVTLMSSHRISPLLWCGRRRLLLLPEQLWRELDDDGRNAVLLHELAHLKRRDHWICWVELLIAATYWWHPLVWWVRRKLRDEADYCCDAWVTAVMPSSRSAYARALLTTRHYLNSERSHAVPAVGLGVTTIQAKRFARRLTMVMTQRSRPRMSIWGGIIALTLAAGAWLSTPLWACPPDECETAAKAPKVKATAVKPAKVKAPRAVIAVPSQPSKPGKAPRAAQDGTTFDEYMEGRDQPAPTPFAPGAFPDDDNASLRHRIDALEHRLNRLTEHLEQLLGHGPRGQGPAHLSHPTPPDAPMPPAPPSPPGVSLRAAQEAMVAGDMRRAAVEGERVAQARAREADTGETVVREYRLPSGKLEALTELMARQDVPVLIERRDGAIAVHATPRQHEIFAGFVSLIHPEGGVQGRSGSIQGQAGAFAGADAVLRAEGLARLRGQLHVEGIESLRGLSGKAREDAIRAYEQAAREALTTEQRKHLEGAQREISKQREAIESQSQKLREKAESLRKKALELQQRSEAFENEAESKKGSARQQLIGQAEALAAQAEALADQADAHEDQADTLADHLEELIEHAMSHAEEHIEHAMAMHEQAMEAEIEAAELAIEAEEAAAEAEEAAAEAAEDAAEAAEEEAEIDDPE